jgi:hypothetical protein
MANMGLIEISHRVSINIFVLSKNQITFVENALLVVDLVG